MPNLVVIARPNGSGKSTMAPKLLRDTLRVDEFINADLIASGLSAFAPDRVAFAAGRIMVRPLQCLSPDCGFVADAGQFSCKRSEADRVADGARFRADREKRAMGPAAKRI